MENQIILFEKYLKGEMSLEEKKIFFSRLKGKTFNNDFEEYKVIRNAISQGIINKDEIELTKTLEKLGQTHFSSGKKFGSIVSLKSNFTIMKMAASFVLLFAFALGFLMLNKSKYNDSILADKYHYKHGSYVTRGAEHAAKARKSAVLYHDANQLFLKGNYKSAKGLYNSLLYNEDPYQEYAEWNLLMIKLKNKDPKDHIKPLNKILENKDHIMYNKALALQKDINVFYRKLPF